MPKDIKRRKEKEKGKRKEESRCRLQMPGRAGGPLRPGGETRVTLSYLAEPARGGVTEVAGSLVVAGGIANAGIAGEKSLEWLMPDARTKWLEE